MPSTKMVIETLKKKVVEEPYYTFAQNIFPVSVFKFDLSDEVDRTDIVNKIKEYKQEYGMSRTSSIQAWHSSFDTHLRCNKFDYLLSIIESKVNLCVKHSRMTAKVFESWGIIYKRGESTVMHNHGISTMSTVYYAQVSDSTAPLQFLNGPSITPTNDTLLVFPGYAYHHVPEVEEDERIVYTSNYTMVPNIYINN